MPSARCPFVQANLIATGSDDPAAVAALARRAAGRRRLGERAGAAVSVSGLARLPAALGRARRSGLGARRRLLPRPLTTGSATSRRRGRCRCRNWRRRPVTGPPPTVLMTADAVGGVWSYCAGSVRGVAGRIRFVLATLGPRPRPAQRAARGPAWHRPCWPRATFVSNGWRAAEADVAAERGAGSTRSPSAARRRSRSRQRLCAGVGSTAARPASRWPIPTCCPGGSAVRREPAPAELARRIADRSSAGCGPLPVVAPTRAVQHDLRRQYGLPLCGCSRSSRTASMSARFARAPKRAGDHWPPAGFGTTPRTCGCSTNRPGIRLAGRDRRRASSHPEHGVARLRHARPLGVLGCRRDMRDHLAQAAFFAAPARYEPFGLGDPGGRRRRLRAGAGRHPVACARSGTAPPSSCRRMTRAGRGARSPA